MIHKRRWLILLLIALVGLVLSGGFWFYDLQEDVLRGEMERDLLTIARLKTDRITAWRQGRMSEAYELGENPLIASHARQFLADQQTPDPSLIAALRVLQKHDDYLDILIVDPQGAVLAGLTDGTHALHPASAEAVSRAIQTRRPVFVDLHAGPGDIPPHTATVTPIFDSDQETARPLGAVILQTDAEQFLYPLLQSWPIPSESAETLLVRRDGDSVLFLNELRHQKDVAMKLRIPLSQTSLPAAKAILGQTGIVKGKDYRGRQVLAVVQPVPDSPWFIISKVDAVEAQTEWRAFSRLILILIAVLLLAVGGGVAIAWQHNEKGHYRELYQAEATQRQLVERHRITLMSVGDGVIATDAQGNVELLNPVAEILTGWKQSEACGRSIEEVFKIVNEHTRATVDSPIRQVMQKGTVVGLANHTLLISRTGTERPIADSGAPIRNENGELTGVVLVFRDQTQERAAWERLRMERERAQKYLDIAGVMLVALDSGGNIQMINPKACEVLGCQEQEVLGKPWIDQFIPQRNRDNVREIFNSLMRGDTELAEFVESPVVTADGRELLIAWRNSVLQGHEGRIFGTLSSGEDITLRQRQATERERLQNQLIQAQRMESVGRLAGGVAHDFNNMLMVIIGQAELALAQVEPGTPLHDGLGEIQKAAERSAELTRQLLGFARKQIVAPVVLDLNGKVAGTLKMLKRLIGEDIDLAWVPHKDLWGVRIDPSQVDQMLTNMVVNARDAISDIGKITIETANVTFDEGYAAAHADARCGDFVMLAVGDNGRGMSKEVLEKVFEPFFTTKSVGEGTGLGLATVYGIIRQNDGFVNAYSEPGQGSVFKIYLPRCRERTETGVGETSHPPRGGTETVLIVEDEESILRVSQVILEKLGYHVLSARTPEEAIRLAGTNSDIDLLLTDVVMPGMNGRELAKRLMAQYPKLRCLYMSGYTANVIAHRGILDEDVRFIQKPFTPSNLARRVREALDEQ